MTDDLQSWSEVPRIAHFCSLFRKAFSLLEFDIQDLEEGLLLLEDEEKLVPLLVVMLLRGCSRTFTKVVTEDNYNKYLRRLFISKAEEAEEDEVEYDFECKDFTERNVDFEDLSLRDRVRVLHQLCEFRLDGEDVSDKVKNLEASSLRVEPLGKDSEGFTYWYFYGTRLYKEAGPSSLTASAGLSSEDRKKRKEKDKKKRKKKDKKKKKKKNSSHSSSEDESPVEGPSLPSWSVACLTLQDWIDLTDKVRYSKKKFDKELYLTLSDNFLPEIIKMFADKEREEQRRLRLLAPKRSSSRIERKRAEQEEKDRVLAEKLEEEDESRIFGETGRRRGRSRHNDELVVEKNRSERMQQREQMKELREKKHAEKEVAKTFPKEVETQKRKVGRPASTPAAAAPPSPPKVEDEDDLSDDSLKLSKKPPKSSKRHYSEDDEDDESQSEIRESPSKEKNHRTKKGEDRRSSKKKSSSSSSGKSSSKKEFRSRKRRHRHSSSSTSSKSKKHKWKSDSSSNEDDPSYSETSEEEDAAILSEESSNETERDEEDEQPIPDDPPKKEEEIEEESPKVSKATASTFANALLKVGTKSTRDSNLDKTVRKSPGCLLQTAGLQKSGNLSSSSKLINGERLNGAATASTDKTIDSNDDPEDDEEPKISFSLYGGHLPVDVGVSFPKSPGDRSGESRLSGGLGSSAGTSSGNQKKDEPNSPVRKVFSNWGGEFFKKNLDYRANTNKILEKMNLSPGGGTVSTPGIAGGATSPHSRKEFLSPFKKSLSNQTNNTPSSEEKKPMKPFLGCS